MSNYIKHLTIKQEADFSIKESRKNLKAYRVREIKEGNPFDRFLYAVGAHQYSKWYTKLFWTVLFFALFLWTA